MQERAGRIEAARERTGFPLDKNPPSQNVFSLPFVISCGTLEEPLVGELDTLFQSFFLRAKEC